MAKIISSIIDGVSSITQEGFGIPAIFGETQQFKVFKHGSGKSRLLFISATRGLTAKIEILQSGSIIEYSFSDSVVTLTIPTTGATAKECFDEYENAIAGVKALITVRINSSGTGQVSTLVETDLTDKSEIILNGVDDLELLLPYYLDTDLEYTKPAKMYLQNLSPEKIYIFNASEDSSGSTFSERISVFDNQDFYFLLHTSNVKQDLLDAATWSDNNEKCFVGLTDDTTILDDTNLFVRTVIVFAKTATLDENAECAIVGLQAPKTPGSTSWDWKRCEGVSAVTDKTLISTALAGNANLFISQSGITHFTDGKMSNGLFIDQRRSRDYMNARIVEAFIVLFTQEEKVSFDNSGIALIKNVLGGKLTTFGDEKILAVASSSQELENSYDNRYQFTIIAPSRAEVLANNQQNIIDRKYPITYSFVEAGAVHDMDIVGKIVLQLD